MQKSQRSYHNIFKRTLKNKINKPKSIKIPIFRVTLSKKQTKQQSKIIYQSMSLEYNNKMHRLNLNQPNLKRSKKIYQKNKQKINNQLIIYISNKLAMNKKKKKRVQITNKILKNNNHKIKP